MAYIFLDESGDLGFDLKKKGTSSVFIVSCLFLNDNKRVVEKIIQKTHSELTKNIKRKIGVLHAVKEKHLTRQRLLKRLASDSRFSVMVLFLNKKSVSTKLHNEKQLLYNYISNKLLNRFFLKEPFDQKQQIELIASRRETNKFFNYQFKDYLDYTLTKNHQIKIKISIKTPHEEKGLQAVDFISWAIFRKYEKKDETYYNLIKNIIVEENPLYP